MLDLRRSGSGNAMGARATYVEGPRFTTFTTFDHQPALWIVTILSVVYAFLALLVRPFLRRKFLRTDVTLLVGYLLGAISYILMFTALHFGVGKSPVALTGSHYANAAQLVSVSIILLLLACGCSSCSQLLQLEELVPGSTDKLVCWISILVCACSSVISTIAVSAGCSASLALNATPNGCSGAVSRWSAATALIIINACLPALVPFYVFKRLRTDLKRKAAIYLSFSFPLMSVPVVAVALDRYLQFHHHGQDGIGIVGFLCCLEVLLGWALICPNIPISRPMALRFTTHGALILSQYSEIFGDSPEVTATIGTAPSRRQPFDRHGDETHLGRFLDSRSASDVADVPVAIKQEQQVSTSLNPYELGGYLTTDFGLKNATGVAPRNQT